MSDHNLTTPDPQFLASVRASEVSPGELALWYTGGAGYVVRTTTTTVLIDPFVGPSNPPDWIRAIPPAFDPAQIADLGEVSAIVLTHEHGDHADPDALGPLGQSTSATVIGPPACIEVARKAGVPEERLVVLPHDQQTSIGDLTLTAVAMNDPGAPGCNGYVIETAGLALLHSGDSLYFPGFAALKERWSFDAVAVSVGSNPPGRNFYLDESGAARVARDTAARQLILHHYDLWQGITLDPERVAVVTAWYSPETIVTAARFGERLTIAASA